MAKKAKNVVHLIPKDEQLKVFEDIKGILRDYNIDSVADAAGVHFTTIYDWLNGQTRSPQLRTILKVADALGYELVLSKKSGAAFKTRAK